MIVSNNEVLERAVTGVLHRVWGEAAVASAS